MRTGIGILAALAALTLAACGDENDGNGPGSETEADLVAMVSAPQACTEDADCCVVIDGCTATAYVVTADDYEEAIVLANQPGNECVDCISPVVKVTCEGGACVGVQLTDMDSPEYQANEGDHCGPGVSGQRSDGLGTDGGQNTPPPGRVFGCGA